MMERFKNWIISFLNRMIDIPELTEEQEEIVIKGLINFLFSFKTGKNEKELEKTGEDFKTWITEFLNKNIDIPFLNEKTERAFIDAIITLLFNFHSPKK